MTVRAAAEKSLLSPRFYAELEAGRANISIGRLLRVANAFDLDLSALVEDDPLDRPIIALLGLRGAGKSTIGPRMAGALGIDFLELDDMVEAEAGLSLPEIFSFHGERYYRELEVECFNAVVEQARPVVLAVSGGIVMGGEIFERVKRCATTVWLKATPEDHMSRVLEQGDDRPIRDRNNAMEELRALLEKREPLYAQSDLTVDTSSLSLTGAVRQTLASLEERGIMVE